MRLSIGVKRDQIGGPFNDLATATVRNRRRRDYAEPPGPRPSGFESEDVSGWLPRVGLRVLVASLRRITSSFAVLVVW